jgi:kumamolisin
MHVIYRIRPIQAAMWAVLNVAGDADPATGYRILVDGQQAVFGGTSAVAPLWAALIARLNQRLGKPVGHLNPLLAGFAGQQSHQKRILQG